MNATKGRGYLKRTQPDQLQYEGIIEFGSNQIKLYGSVVKTPGGNVLDIRAESIGMAPMKAKEIESYIMRLFSGKYENPEDHPNV